MVIEVQGDLLDQDAGIICHQTNFYGVMGGGIAYAIKERLLTPQQYAEYQDFCRVHGREALGRVQCIQLLDGRYLANIYSQDDAYSDSGNLTDYGHLFTALTAVKRLAIDKGLTVAVPGYIGCGIAGGDWAVVRDIICEVFASDDAECTIVYLQK